MNKTIISALAVFFVLAGVSSAIDPNPIAWCTEREV
jgi:hypothetical protein